MRPNDLYLNQPKAFWAYVRSISEAAGYTVRGQGQIKVPSAEDMANALESLGLDPTKARTRSGPATRLGETLLGYFTYRAEVLNQFVAPRLMDAGQARALFQKLRKAGRYEWPVPMNKQKGKKKAPAYLTAVVNMLIEAN
jgi:signal recognition particle subunit SEC65